MRISGMVQRINQKADGSTFLELTDVVYWLIESDKQVLTGKLKVTCRKNQLSIHVSAMQSKRVVIDTWNTPVFNFSAKTNELSASHIETVSLWSN